MNLKVFINKWFLLLLLISCEKTEERIVVWELINGYESNLDSSQFRKTVISDTIVFEYDYNFENFSNPLIIKLTKDSTLIIGETDFMKPAEASSLIINGKIRTVLKYEFPDSPPGGQGCWLINHELGMIGNGLYVGGKLVISKFGNEKLNNENITALMRYQIKAPPPPPPSSHEKYWPDSLRESEFKEIEKEIKNNAP